MKAVGLCCSWLFVCLFASTVSPGESTRIVSRQEWGARPPKATTRLRQSRPYVFIHHSDSRQCFSQTVCTSVLRGIQNWHMDHRRWSDIGYNFLVGGDGAVYEGRGWDNQGAHTKGYNSRSIGICLIGNFMSDTPTDAQISATKELIAEAVSNGKLSSDYKLLGHKDGGSTSCPGNTLYALIKTWPHYGK